MTAPEGGGGSTAKPKATGAGFGGVGAGTGVVGLAQIVGPQTTIGLILIWAAPAISFVTGAAVYYAQVQINRYLERRLVANAKKTLEAQLDNPKTSDAHKEEIRKMLEAVEKQVAANELERVRLIGIPQRVENANVRPDEVPRQSDETAGSDAPQQRG